MQFNKQDIDVIIRYRNNFIVNVKNDCQRNVLQSMSNKIINVEQSEYWNEKSGPKWVRIDDSMNERFSGLTDELFHRSKIVQNDRVLDVGCGGGETSFRASPRCGGQAPVTAPLWLAAWRGTKEAEPI